MNSLRDLQYAGLSYLSAYEQKKRQVWNKGRIIPDFDPDVWRWDDHGAVIRYADYGDQSSPYGWQFDHYPTPASLGGSDDVSNLRPLHHVINATLGGILGGALSRR